MPNTVSLNFNERQRLLPADAIGNTEVFVNASGAGDFLELHPATVQRLAREGVIPAHPVTGGKRKHWRFLLSELSEWLRSRTGENHFSSNH